MKSDSHKNAVCADYFPRIAPHETLLFRQYDSRQEAIERRMVFHCAIEDPLTPPDAPMRSTIEVRMLAVYRELDTEREARVARFSAQLSHEYPDGTGADWWSGPIEDHPFHRDKAKL